MKVAVIDASLAVKAVLPNPWVRTVPGHESQEVAETAEP
jgi:hypothetical protein